MSYYNKNCEKINLNDMRYLDSGSSANVYYNQDIIFKKYFNHLYYKDKINLKIFNLLKQINNPHLIKLFDIYSEMNLLDLFLYKTRKNNFTIDAYTAKYYKDNSVNILYESIDYILDNFRELEILFETLTDNKILTNDIKKHNTIIGKDNIIIIDPDRFSFSSESKSSITIHNKTKLLMLFRSLCYYGTKEIEYNYNNHWQIMKKIETEFNSEKSIIINEKTDITYEISKKLKYVKTPLEYFMKQD